MLLFRTALFGAVDNQGALENRSTQNIPRTGQKQLPFPNNINMLMGYIHGYLYYKHTIFGAG